MTGDAAHPRDAAGVLEASRAREKAQALYYRGLAAGVAEDPDAVERLNELHADEQHHLSRLTARLLELGGRPEDLSGVAAPDAAVAGWEAVAREREAAEVRWYESLAELDLDADTLVLLAEILDSERHHQRELRGKWMSA